MPRGGRASSTASAARTRYGARWTASSSSTARCSGSAPACRRVWSLPKWSTRDGLRAANRVFACQLVKSQLLHGSLQSYLAKFRHIKPARLRLG